MERDALERAVAGHCDRPALLQRIAEGLKAAGIEPNAPELEDLAPVDESHTAGRITTLRALEKLGLSAGMRVLDAGCGIGGTARCIARQHGCPVTGIDLTPSYAETARDLARRTGLDDLCTFVHGSVLDMPFADGGFSAAITLHVAMNIADREAFYAELARVVVPGAPLCVFDVMKGPREGMAYPAPWAETAETSFLRTLQETVALLEAAGFEVTERENLREFAVAFLDKVFATNKAAGGPPPVGLHLLTGANGVEKFSNFYIGLRKHQVEPVMLLARRT
ncbi:MAG: methyltransferase domain-containing protein [Rhodobiaceae bacterium]|nr:methyltransferase domain-containing protein [Rhodobiaceae bacterium]